MTHGRKPKQPVAPAVTTAQPGSLGSYGEARSVDAKASSVVIPRLKTISALNARETWRQRDRRVREERTMARLYMQKVRRPIDAASIVIHLVRIGPGKLDSDNLQGAMKAVRDGVADWLGIDDGSDRLTWTYAQERSGGPGLYAVRIEVTPC